MSQRKNVYIVMFTNTLGQRKMYSEKAWRTKKGAKGFIRREIPRRKRFGYSFKNPRVNVIKLR